MSAVLCDHKDCERTDATRVDFRRYNPDETELLDERTYHFCPYHRMQHFRLEKSRTLPPEEWFGEGVRSD